MTCATSRRATPSASSSSSSATPTRRWCSTSSTSTPRCRRTSRCTCWRWSTASRGCSTSPPRSKVYVMHQMEVVQRRTEYRLRQAQERAHIVEGLVKALDMIDAIIALIRGAEDVDAARQGLQAAPFEFTEIQADHILDMQLRRLTQLEGKKLRDELAELQATIAELQSILDSKTKLRTVIKDELGELRDEVRRRAQDRHHRRHRRPRRARPHRRRRGRRRAVEASGYIKTVDGRRVPAPGARRPRRARRQPARRGLRRAPPHHHRALVPVVLLEPRARRTDCARTRSR